MFREAAPENFDNFFRALSTMFRLTAGDTWVDGLAAYDGAPVDELRLAARRAFSALVDLCPYPPTFFCTKRSGTPCISRRPGWWIGVLCRLLSGVPMRNWTLLAIAVPRCGGAHRNRMVTMSWMFWPGLRPAPQTS